HAEGLGPTAVVADAHAEDAAHHAPDLEALVADLEVTLLQVLERRLGQVLGMTGQVDLAVAADDLALGVDQDRGVEPTCAARLLRELGVAEIESDAQLL